MIFPKSPGDGNAAAFVFSNKRLQAATSCYKLEKSVSGAYPSLLMVVHNLA